MRYAARNATLLEAFEAAVASGTIDYNAIGRVVDPPVKAQQVKLILKQMGITDLPAAKTGRPRNVVFPLSNIHEHIGNLLYQYLVAEEISDEDFASENAIPVKVIEKIKEGVHNITLCEIQTLATAMSKPLVDLIKEGV